jgi:hypothetical protein
MEGLASKRIVGWTADEILKHQKLIDITMAHIAGYQKRQVFVQDLMRLYMVAISSAAISQQSMVAFAGMQANRQQSRGLGMLNKSHWFDEMIVFFIYTLQAWQANSLRQQWLHLLNLQRICAMPMATPAKSLRAN